VRGAGFALSGHETELRGLCQRCVAAKNERKPLSAP
jgi:Fur family zinc uptake transcriptional regulator